MEPKIISYDSLLILSVLAFLTPILVNSIKGFKIPVVVAEIILGIIIGKSFLNLIGDDIWIQFLSTFGLAYLMFLSGLEIDAGMIKQPSQKNRIMNPLFLGAGLFGISLVVSYFGAQVLHSQGLVNNSFVMIWIIAAAAPGIVIPVLREKKIMNTVYGQTLLIFTIISEFVCLLFLTVSVSISSTGLSYKSFLFITVFLAFFLIYRLTNLCYKKVQFFYSNINLSSYKSTSSFRLDTCSCNFVRQGRNRNYSGFIPGRYSLFAAC